MNSLDDQEYINILTYDLVMFRRIIILLYYFALRLKVRMFHLFSAVERTRVEAPRE